MLADYQAFFLKIIKSVPGHRLRFDMKKIRKQDVVCTFQAMMCGKWATLIGPRADDMSINSIIQH